MNYTPHKYQQTAIDFLVGRWLGDERGSAPYGAGLLLDPGLGKTSITLNVLETLKVFGEMESTLIVAPLRVCRSVWPAEIEKWQCDLTCSLLLGTPRQRARGIEEETDIKIINPEGLAWLSTYLAQNHVDFDTIVFDESTKFKGWGTKRHKTLRKGILRRFERRLILTGTPTPNHYGDLFAQMYLLDDGDTLGQTQNYFRQRFMSKGGFKGREWSFDESRTDDIEAAIAPFVLRMSAEDHLDLPDRIDNVIRVQLPDDVMAGYKQFERELFMSLGSGEDLTASSAGAKYTLCRGIANGGAYIGEPPDRSAEFVHDAKVDALADLVDELGGKPVLVAYQFHHDLERLRKRFPKAPAIKGGMKPDETDEIIAQWNQKEIEVLLCQPQAMSHGLNMQSGGNDVVWLGLTDQLEVYQQFNCRVYRQGVKGGVRIHHILADDTVDQAIFERLQEKADRQTSLLDALNNYRLTQED